VKKEDRKFQIEQKTKKLAFVEYIYLSFEIKNKNVF